jgi:Methyltransferase domain
LSKYEAPTGSLLAPRPTLRPYSSPRGEKILTAQLRHYLKHGHKLVEGWMLPAAGKMIATLSAVQEAQHIGGNVAEIGVHHGKLFILLYLLTRGEERAVAVDLFANQVQNIDHSGAGDLDKFRANLARHADADMRRLVVHEGDSTALDGLALKRLAGGAYRLISIDGGHSAKTTAHDLAIAVEALAPGGVIILDDYFNEMWPGVSEGVHRYFHGPHGILPFAMGANKMLFCAPSAIPLYVDSLRSIATRTFEHDFLGARVLWCNFAPLPLTERIGKDSRWCAVKDHGPIRIARRAYHSARGVRSSFRSRLANAIWHLVHRM